MEAEDYAARCIQHEIDHLNGILFVDHVKDGELYHEQSKEKVNLFEVIRMTRSGM